MTTNLEQRIQRLEDRAALGELVARYALAVDDRDFDLIEKMFSRDCRVETAQGKTTGRKAVVAFYRQRIESFGPTYHIPHMQSLDFESDEKAEGTVMAHVELAIDGETYVVALRYHDAYVKEGANWYFQERRMSQLYALPLSQLPTGLAKDFRKLWPDTPAAPGDWPPA